MTTEPAAQSIAIGLDSYSFEAEWRSGRYDLFAILDRMEANGFSGIQININGPRCKFLGGEANDAAYVRRVRESLARKGFFSEIGGRGTDLKLLDGIDDPAVGACLDSGNDLVLYGDPVDAAAALAPRAITTHLKDQRLIRRGGETLSLGVPFGAGDVDLAGVLRAIRSGSRLERLLIQDTTGYLCRVNPFGRADLVAGWSERGLPVVGAEARRTDDGVPLGLDEVDSAALAGEAAAQRPRLLEDLRFLRSILSRGGR